MKSYAYAASVLDYVLTGKRPEFDGDRALELCLHTADPGSPGTAATNEVRYPGYRRVPVPRDVSGWRRTGAVSSNALAHSFPPSAAPEGESVRATWWSLVRPGGGAAMVLYRGELDGPLDIRRNVRPDIAPGVITIGEE